MRYKKYMNTPSLAREYSSAEINWQQQYKNSIKSIDALCNVLNLQIDQLSLSNNANQSFPLRVPWSYVRRMQKSNPLDPLLLQVLPQAQEEHYIEGFSVDPVGDLASTKSAGLLQKYYGRALLLTTSRCGVHCRYCFRRHFPYSKQNPRYDSWQNAINELSNDPSINEVILSGGDPLVLDDAELDNLVSRLEFIPHIKRIRIHTRLPVVIPDRINKTLINWINKSSLQIIVVLHINHAQEMDQYLQLKIQSLLAANCTLLNQSVLLKNINDHSDKLVKLSEALFSAGVLPYYLHMLDKVHGAAHFEVCESQARSIMQEVQNKLPGYLVPKLVIEKVGLGSKTQINM